MRSSSTFHVLNVVVETTLGSTQMVTTTALDVAHGGQMEKKLYKKKGGI